MPTTKRVATNSRLQDDDYEFLGWVLLGRMIQDKDLGLNALRLGVFLVLDGGFYEPKEFSLEQFAKALRLTSSRIPNALARLEAAGYVEKDASVMPNAYRLAVKLPKRRGK